MSRAERDESSAHAPRGLAVFGSAMSAILQGCGSPTSPSNAPALPVVTGTRVSTGITVADRFEFAAVGRRQRGARAERRRGLSRGPHGAGFLRRAHRDLHP